MEEKSFYSKSNNIRESAQKVRLTAAMVKDMGVEDAIQLLAYVNQKAARHIQNTIKSAVANAAHAQADVQNLIVGTIKIDAAPIYPRMRAASRGRGNRILKRGCHIYVELKERKD